MTAVDESLSPSPTLPRQTPKRPLFGFGEATEPIPADLPSNPPLSPTSLPTTEDSLEELEQASADEWDDEEDGSGSPAATSSRGSTRVANPVGSEGLRDMARAGVLIAGDQAHNLLARTEGQQAVGLYRTDQDDAERIGDPLARIAGRHQGVGEMNEDTADLLASMLGLARFATKQITLSHHAKALDAGPKAPAADGRGAVDL